MERIIIHNEQTKKFETIEDGITGYVQYEEYPGGLDLTHTIVPKPIEGRGIAAAIVKHVLDYALEHGLKVRPTCSYVKVYIDRHKEQYGSLEDAIESKFPAVEALSGSTGMACGINKQKER